jgi:hypothetical protein
MTTLSGPSMAGGGAGRGTSLARGTREPPSGECGAPLPAVTLMPAATFGPFPFMA